MNDMERYVIKPHPKLKEFFEVLIFEKHVDMVEFLKIIDPTMPEYRACILWRKKVDKRKGLAVVTFSREWLDLDSVSHECFHASLAFFRQMGIHYDVYKFNRQKEELLCSMHQYLLAQISEKVPNIKKRSTFNGKNEFLNSMKFYSFNEVLPKNRLKSKKNI